MQYQKLFQWLAKTFKRVLWVERSGGSLRSVEQLITHFPDARFVHLVRDGRDCAISMSHHYGFRMVVIAFALTGMLSIDPFEDSDRSQIDDVTDWQGDHARYIGLRKNLFDLSTVLEHQ